MSSSKTDQGWMHACRTCGRLISWSKLEMLSNLGVVACRHVVLPPDIAKLLPKNRLLSEVSSPHRSRCS